MGLRGAAASETQTSCLHGDARRLDAVRLPREHRPRLVTLNDWTWATGSGRWPRSAHHLTLPSTDLLVLVLNQYHEVLVIKSGSFPGPTARPAPGRADHSPV